MPSDVVRVWSIDLDQPVRVVERLDLMLPAEERGASAPTRVARAAARIVLGDVLGIDPGKVVISRRCEHCGNPTHGRPVVVGADDCSFSLSHSGVLGVIAVTQGDARVGIDVEAVRARRRLGALAARVLNEDEHAAWMGIDDDDEQLRVFLRVWTAKEAYLKALGIGIATRLRDVPARVEGWRTQELDVGDASIAALSVDRTEFTVERAAVALGTTWSDGTAS